MAESGRRQSGTKSAESSSAEVVPVTESAELVPVGPRPDGARRSDVDEWGRSERVRALARLLLSPVYDHWFRVEWEGLEKLPRSGGALLIANHGGALPADAPMIMHGIEQELKRPVYGLADRWFRSLPTVGTLWSRAGGVVAHPENAHRLLREQGQLALVFPEGEKGPSKLVTERYRLRRFGRGGFVETAMRAGVPVIPITVVGAEESMPIIYRARGAAKALRLPYLPVTVNHLLFGPVLGTVVHLPTKFRFRVLDPVTFDVEPCLDRYPRSAVMEAAESIRRDMQENLYDMLAKRQSIWFG